MVQSKGYLSSQQSTQLADSRTCSSQLEIVPFGWYPDKTASVAELNKFATICTPVKES